MITTESKPHPIKEFCRVLKRERGVDRAYSTVLGWIEDGVRVKGNSFFLQASSIGGTLHVTLEQYDDWVQEQTRARKR